MRIAIAAAAAATVLVLVVSAPPASATTVTFTAGVVKDAMLSSGAPLSDGTNQWGLWAVRAVPVVKGGGFTIAGGSTSQAGWGVDAPSSYSWNTYGTNCAWFWDASGAEVSGVASNPLYMIMDVPASNFWSSSFNGSGSWVGNWSPGGGGTFYTSGYDGGAGGTNVITAVDDTATFSFDFTLDPGAIWNGQIHFLVDGSKYTLGSHSSPGVWVENFFGDYGSGGGLPGNTGTGYTALPEPLTMVGLGMALLGVGGYIRRRRMS
jgi:hypothetical protein